MPVALRYKHFSSRRREDPRERGNHKVYPTWRPLCKQFPLLDRRKKEGKEKEEKVRSPTFAYARRCIHLAPLCIDIKYTLSIPAKFSRGEQPAG